MQPTDLNISILLVDDHAIVRSGVRAYLDTRPDLSVVGEAGSGAEAVRMCADLKPDVVLMDLMMPDMDGVEATWRVRRVSPDSRVIALTSFHDDSYVFPAIKAGAISYLLKDVSPEELAEAVYAAARGEPTLHPRVAVRLMEELRGEHSSVNLFHELSEREQEVLRLIASGMSNADIAAELVISEKTVKGHVSSILGKLHLEDRTQAAVLAWKEGLMRGGG
jgi:NarL family two-component system response regulator LiaR